jgi:hypothetical protein
VITKDFFGIKEDVEIMETQSYAWIFSNVTRFFQTLSQPNRPIQAPVMFLVAMTKTGEHIHACVEGVSSQYIGAKIRGVCAKLGVLLKCRSASDGQEKMVEQARGRLGWNVS